MKKPKMIIFDYGNTLIYETELDLAKAYDKLYDKISKNPDNVSREEFIKRGVALIDKIVESAVKKDVEFQHTAIFKSLFEVLNVEVNMPLDELEFSFWEDLAPGSDMPNIKKLLAFLNEQKIRTAVISNMSFSEPVLARRINKYIPDNNFEFIMASSTYGFRKPDPILFEIALKKSGLKAEEVWYCGDNLRADVLGSSAVGISPVLFTHHKPCPYYNESDTKVDFEYLKISNWTELIKLLSFSNC